MLVFLLPRYIEMDCPGQWTFAKEREGQTGVVGETPDSQPGNPYDVREVTIDHSLRGSNPGPPDLVTGPLGHSAPTVTH